MKTKFSILSLILIVFAIGACSQIKHFIGLVDTPTKKYILVQEEVNVALEQYKTYLNAQDVVTQAALHAKYDDLIIALDAALDAWHEMVRGITLDTGQIEKFMDIKNKLILAGWNFFEKK